MPKAELRSDIVVHPSPALEQRAAALLARIGVPGQLPAWPSQDMQKKYTGVHGIALMRSTLCFIDTLDRAGVFASPGWRGLDYGCGWGRIASLLLTKGTPNQLDLCDAWPKTIELLRGADFPNRIFSVPEVLEDGDLEREDYDFIYAYSVFTHLRRDVFENNLRVLFRALKPAGKLYITVRHADYMPRVKARSEDLKTLSREGFWFRPHGTNALFGAAVTEQRYLEALPMLKSLEYLGEVDLCQHLYALGV